MKKFILLFIILLLIQSCSSKSGTLNKSKKIQIQEIEYKSDEYFNNDSIEIVNSYSINKKYKVIRTIKEIQDEHQKKKVIIYLLKNKAKNMGGDAIMDVKVKKIEKDSGYGYGVREQNMNDQTRMHQEAFNKKKSPEKKLWTAKVIIWINEK